VEGTCWPLTQNKGRGLLEPLFKCFFYWPYWQDNFKVLLKQRACFLPEGDNITNSRLFCSCYADKVLYCSTFIWRRGCQKDASLCAAFTCALALVQGKPTDWASHIAVFRCSRLQLSAALLSFLWDLLSLVISFLFVWKVYDDIKHLIYYHYSNNNLQLQTQWILICTKSTVAINLSLISVSLNICDSPVIVLCCHTVAKISYMSLRCQCLQSMQNCPQHTLSKRELCTNVTSYSIHRTKIKTWTVCTCTKISDRSYCKQFSLNAQVRKEVENMLEQISEMTFCGQW